MDRFAADDAGNETTVCHNRDTLRCRDNGIDAADGFKVYESFVGDVLYNKSDLIAVASEHNAWFAFGIANAKDVTHDVGAHAVAPRPNPLANELLHIVLISGWAWRLDKSFEKIFAIGIHDFRTADTVLAEGSLSISAAEFTAEPIRISAGTIMRDRQLRGDTAPHIEVRCDLLRRFRERDCDFVHLVLAPDWEIQSECPTRPQPRPHRRMDKEDTTRPRLRESHQREMRRPVYRKTSSQECSDQSFRIRMCRVPHPRPPNTRPPQLCFGE